MSMRPEVDLIIETATRKLNEPGLVDQALGRDLLGLAVELIEADAVPAAELVAEWRARWLDAADLVTKVADTLDAA